MLELFFLGQVGVGVTAHALAGFGRDLGEGLGVVPVVDSLDDRATIARGFSAPNTPDPTKIPSQP